jgi:hypothetical protein
VTSDLGAGPTTLAGGQCRPGGDGARLQGVGAAADPSCKPLGGGLRYVDYDQITGKNNLPAGQSLAQTLGCMAQVGDKGCGFEHHLEAVYRALHDPIPENAGFLRDGALLAVVLVTDGDDCSAPPDSDLFDPGRAEYGAFSSFRCIQFGVECLDPTGQMAAVAPVPGAPLQMCQSQPDATHGGAGKLYDLSRYITFFSHPRTQGGVKADATSVIFASLVAPVTPFQVGVGDPTAAGFQPCPPGAAPGSDHCALVINHSCTGASGALFGDPAVRINQLLAQVPSHQIASICDADYGGSMSNLGQLLAAEEMAPACVGAPLADPARPTCVVEDVSTRGEGQSISSTVPACDASRGTTPCWRLTPSARCSPVATSTGASEQLRLEVDRGGVAPSAGTVTHARCLTL